MITTIQDGRLNKPKLILKVFGVGVMLSLVTVAGTWRWILLCSGYFIIQATVGYASDVWKGWVRHIFFQYLNKIP